VKAISLMTLTFYVLRITIAVSSRNICHIPLLIAYRSAEYNDIWGDSQSKDGGKEITILLQKLPGRVMILL
jgi:hypothetical protein